MKQVIAKTFGGLTKQYYIRQFIFGLMFPAFFLYITLQGNHQTSIPLGTMVSLIVNTLLYPYSRFVYESIMGFILGNTVFWTNALILLAAKCITMLFCWAFAIFIAPFGLAYLYLYHSKQEQDPHE